MSGFLSSASPRSWWRRVWACCGGWSSSSSVSSLAKGQSSWVTGPGAANLTFDRNKEWFIYLTWYNKFDPPFIRIIPMPITFYSDEHWASFMNIPKMQYCTMQVIIYMFINAVQSLNCTSTLQNITVQLETNFINYEVKPKVAVFITVFIHGIAASFFCFSALYSRWKF